MTARPTVRRGARAGLLALSVLLGSQPADALAGAARTVTIANFAYAPAVLRVAAGTTVTWVNHDEEPHTVTSATGAFASGGLSRDETFSQRFATPGTYAYACALHPHMKATVIVQ
jgi:plastocyanin